MVGQNFENSPFVCFSKLLVFNDGFQFLELGRFWYIILGVILTK